MRSNHRKKQKVIEAKENLAYLPLDVKEIFTFEQIRETYENEGQVLIDQQVQSIKEFLETLLEINFLIFQQKQINQNNLDLKPQESQHEKSNFVHPRKYR
jgi:hypothetical protein